MSSLLSSLARKLSEGGRNQSAMVNIPSFNDFGTLQTPEDAEQEYRRNNLRRHSFDGDQQSDRRVVMDGPADAGFSQNGRSEPWSIPGSSRLSSPTGSVPPTPFASHQRKFKERKIHGMDMYDYCELIRSL